MSTHPLSDAEFIKIQRFIFERAGITLSAAKKGMVASRLAKRLDQCGVNSYAEYMRLLERGDSAPEAQAAIDVLTTNETFFFREPKHFEFLRKEVMAARGLNRPFRVWSAAGSTGEEAYSIAMVLEDLLPGGAWEVLCSDISQRVMARAQLGHYSTARTDHISPEYLRRFCLKGQGEQLGTLLIKRSLRDNVRFLQINLNATLPPIGRFDVVFLRNVLIYFDTETKRSVVERVLTTLNPGGAFLIGHSDSLSGVSTSLQQLAPAIYRIPNRAAVAARA